MTIKRLLLDGDVFVYRAAGAAKETEPVEAALGNAKSMIHRVLHRFADAEPTVYLTGAGNFRDTRATIQPYKGNRDRSKRPCYYKQTREYLLDIWKAVLVEGIEADDAMGTEQWANKDKSTCIVTNDKDLNMIPGWHYHFVNEDLYYVTLKEANRNFYLQMLSGDRTDHIRGCDGIGSVRANRILVDAGSDPTAWASAIRQEYQRCYGDTWKEALLETADLLWIQREKEQQCPLPLL